MKTKKAVLSVLSALSMAAGAAQAGEVVWWFSSSGGCGSSASFGAGCGSRPVVTYYPYVPVVVTAPACAWGLGTRTVVVPACVPQRHWMPASPPVSLRGCGPHPMPPPRASPMYAPGYRHHHR